MNEIKFGVFLPFYAFLDNYYECSSVFGCVRRVILECERLGYHSVWLDDHMMFEQASILESWTSLSALAACTSRIRLGTMVLCNSFRHPAVLAKMATTLDNISGGRLELGIGAGSQKEEHDAFGFGFPRSAVRIERLKEAAEIIEKMWTEEKVEFAGKHYKISQAVCEPKPVQKPHPPIVIGGSGEKLTMKVAARFADRFDWGYIPTLELYEHKLKILESYCEKIGRDFQKIEKSCWPWGQIFIESNPQNVEKTVQRAKPKGVPLEDFKKNNFVGSAEACQEKIQKYKNIGVTHFMLFFGDLPNLNGLRLFAKRTMKKE